MIEFLLNNINAGWLRIGLHFFFLFLRCFSLHQIVIFIFFRSHIRIEWVLPVVIFFIISSVAFLRLFALQGLNQIDLDLWGLFAWRHRSLLCCFSVISLLCLRSLSGLVCCYLFTAITFVLRHVHDFKARHFLRCGSLSCHHIGLHFGTISVSLCLDRRLLHLSLIRGMGIVLLCLNIESFFCQLVRFLCFILVNFVGDFEDFIMSAPRKLLNSTLIGFLRSRFSRLIVHPNLASKDSILDIWLLLRQFLHFIFLSTSTHSFSPNTLQLNLILELSLDTTLLLSLEFLDVLHLIGYSVGLHLSSLRVFLLSLLFFLRNAFLNSFILQAAGGFCGFTPAFFLRILCLPTFSIDFLALGSEPLYSI